MNPFTSATKIEERIVLSATRKRIPLGGAFELLPLCNMNCRMCFLRLSPEEMHRQGGRLRTPDEWLALAREAREAGLLFLLLTGGEPFLYPEFEKLYRGLTELGLILTINSNGTQITEQYADLLAQHLPRRVNITLYGSSDEIYRKLCGNPNGFTQTMRGIRLLKERNIAVKLNGSLTPDNRDDLEAIQKIARKLEIPLEVDTYMYPSSRKDFCSFDQSSRLTPRQAAEGWIRVKKDILTEEEFAHLAQAMSECYREAEEDDSDDIDTAVRELLPCRAGLSSFWVNWKGIMTPCVFMDQPGMPVFAPDGSNTAPHFKEAWGYVKRERDRLFLPAACSKCKKRPFCPVCGACVYTETGGYEKKPEYMCALTQEKLRCMDEITRPDVNHKKIEMAVKTGGFF